METLKFVMTTTFYPPYHIGGDAIHVYYLSNELAKLGHEIHIIHNIDSYSWQRKDNPAKNYSKNYSNHDNVIVHSIKSPIGKVSPLISYIFGPPFPVTRRINEIVHNVNADVLHHHNIAGFGPFILKAKAPNVLYTAHDYWLVCPMNTLLRYDKTRCIPKSNCFSCSIRSNRPPQIWRRNDILKKYMKKVDSIITPSNFVRNKLQESGIQGNFITIPNFVPDPLETGIPLYNFPYFLFVGVIEEHKGILDLVNMFLNAKDEIQAKLLIVGVGSLERSIKNIIVKNGCSDKILMVGKIDNKKTLANIYANSLATIIPSICHENCPLAALESLSYGTPIIVTDNGGLPELVSISDTVIVVKNVDDLIRAIVEFGTKKKKFVEENNSGFNRFYKDYKKILNF